MKKLLTFFLLTLSCGVFGQASVRVADSLINNSEYKLALDYLASNENNIPKAQKVQSQATRAEALIHLGKFDDADKLLTSLQNQSNTDFENGIIRTNLGFLFINQGRNDRALEVLKTAINDFDKSNKSNSLESARALTLLGLVYKYTGKHTQAQDQLQMALSYREKLLPAKHELIAASYNDLGLVYAGIDNDRALDYYEKAMKIYQALHGNDHQKIAIASMNTGVVYNDLELYGDAVNNFERALKIWEKLYPQPHQAKAFALLNLGDTYLNMGNQKAARGYYDRSLEMYRHAYGNKHPEIAGVLNKLGNIVLADGEFRHALSFYQQALAANTKDFDEATLEKNPSLNNFYNGNVLLYSLLFKSRAFEKQYFGKTLKLSDLKNSLQTLHKCDTLIDKLRQQSTNENDKISLGIIASEVYADGVRIAFETAQNSIDKKRYLNEAFYFAERSKSAVLLEAISDSEAKSFAGIPGELMEEEKNLKSALALTAQKLSQRPGLEEEKALRENAYTLNRQYESFTKRLEQKYPEYFNLKFNTTLPSIGQIQKLLQSTTAVISYFTDEANARLYTFVITKEKFRIYDNAIPKEFDKYITGLRNSLFYNEITSFAKTSRNLGKLLIPKIPAGVTDLMIIPTGRMSIIPFETLLSENAEEKPDYKTLPYLVNKFTVRYEFSASLLLQKTKREKIASSASIFLCAPVSFPEKENLADLPGTESEVKEISALFTNKNLVASTSLHTQANESVIKDKSIQNYNLLHFATHGIVDEKNPELSRIFLQTDSDREDGNLFSGEIYNLKLNANLVTLSACQTGLGKISKGEGVIGLSRALVYAGAKNIIVSFWSVADESTSALMKDFYRTLLENNSVDYTSSLRMAKLKLIQGDQYSAPYFWAPFILIGF
jgi:CHAT domain-containing protein/predicted negative regulator of RcsB-dependent stress response